MPILITLNFVNIGYSCTAIIAVVIIAAQCTLLQKPMSCQLL